MLWVVRAVRVERPVGVERAVRVRAACELGSEFSEQPPAVSRALSVGLGSALLWVRADARVTAVLVLGLGFGPE